MQLHGGHANLPSLFGLAATANEVPKLIQRRITGASTNSFENLVSKATIIQLNTLQL
jgi:hypothetical protein